MDLHDESQISVEQKTTSKCWSRVRENTESFDPPLLAVEVFRDVPTFIRNDENFVLGEDRLPRNIQFISNNDFHKIPDLIEIPAVPAVAQEPGDSGTIIDIGDSEQSDEELHVLRPGRCYDGPNRWGLRGYGIGTRKNLPKTRNPPIYISPFVTEANSIWEKDFPKDGEKMCQNLQRRKKRIFRNCASTEEYRDNKDNSAARNERRRRIVHGEKKEEYSSAMRNISWKNMFASDGGTVDILNEADTFGDDAFKFNSNSEPNQREFRSNARLLMRSRTETRKPGRSKRVRRDVQVISDIEDLDDIFDPSSEINQREFQSSADLLKRPLDRSKIVPRRVQLVPDTKNLNDIFDSNSETNQREIRSNARPPRREGTRLGKCRVIPDTAESYQVCQDEEEPPTRRRRIKSVLSTLSSHDISDSSDEKVAVANLPAEETERIQSSRVTIVTDVILEKSQMMDLDRIRNNDL